MDYVSLGTTPLQISRLGLGAMGFGDTAWRSWVLDIDQARPVFERAVHRGINFFDTCNFYSGGESERILGQLLRETGQPREEVVIATKFGMPMPNAPETKGYSRSAAVAAIAGSLERLELDYVDLYQTHIWDPDTDLEELMAVLAELIDQGKVRYAGATDMPNWQFVKANGIAQSHGRPSFSSMQNHYNLVWREDEAEMIPYCRAEGIGWIPYSPLARGLLCGASRLAAGQRTERLKTDEYIDIWYGREADRALISRVDEVARKHGAKPAQVALAWVLSREPSVAPIFGARTPAQVDEAVEALDLKLDENDEEQLTAAYVPRLRGS
ncbi:MAG: aldo/keto reductase [Pseudomonadota bacterium]